MSQSSITIIQIHHKSKGRSWDEVDKEVAANHTYSDSQLRDAEEILKGYDEFGFQKLELQKTPEEETKEKLK